VSLSVFVLAASAARGEGPVVGCEDWDLLPAASAIAAGLHSCAIQAGSGAVVCWGPNGERPATPPHPAHADEFEPSIPVARAEVEELAHPELVPDPPLDPGEPGDADFERAFDARVGEVLDQSAESAAKRLMPLLETREAERLDEVTRSAVRRVKQELARAVERRLLDAPGAETIPPPPELVADERGEEVYRPSVDGSAGTASEIAAGGNPGCAIQADTSGVVSCGNDSCRQATPPPAVNGSTGTTPAIAAGTYHGCALQAGTRVVVCGGHDESGQATPPASVDGSAGTASAIAAAVLSNCAIQAGSGAVVCWGTRCAATPPPSVDATAGTASAMAATIACARE